MYSVNTRSWIISIAEYGLTYLVIGFSAVPFFSNSVYSLAVITAILFLFVISRRKYVIHRKHIYLLILLLLILLMQVITTGVMDFRSMIGTLVRFIFPFLSLLILKKEYIQKFVHIVFILTILGLVIFFLKNISTSFHYLIIRLGEQLPFDKEVGHHFLVYSSRFKVAMGIIRTNSGFAGEPGAYAIILTIAILFNLYLSKKMFTRYGLVFILAMISTFSTAGYISLTLIVFGYVYSKAQRSKTILLIGFPALIFVTYLIYKNVDFMGDKIEGQIGLAESRYESRGRFASASSDLEVWKTNPLWGTGKSEEAYISAVTTLGFERGNRVNGLAHFLAKFGLILFVIYLYGLYKSILMLSRIAGHPKYSSIFYLLSLLSVAFAQICMQWPLYIILLFLPIALKSGVPLERS